MKRDAQTAQRKALLNNLFELWDNDGSGFLDLDDIEAIMTKYKDGADVEALLTGQKIIVEFQQQIISS